MNAWIRLNIQRINENKHYMHGKFELNWILNHKGITYNYLKKGAKAKTGDGYETWELDQRRETETYLDAYLVL